MIYLIKPAEGRTSSVFGTPRDGGARRHTGIDIAIVKGTPVKAAAAGSVSASGWLSSLAGNGVKVDHGGGCVTSYFHLSRASVSVGEWVQQGQVIGLSGATGDATGPHLHWEVRLNNVAIDPLRALSEGVNATPIAQSTFSNVAPIQASGQNKTLLLVLVFLLLVAARH